MNNSVFDFKDYKAYLSAKLQAEAGKIPRGGRLRLANFIGVQPAFVSQVLNGDSHFNLEHGQKINRFLEHSEEETHFFLLLISLARSGTRELADYYTKQIEHVLQQRLVVKSRFKEAQTISQEDRGIYYSAWYYGAIRVLVAIPGFQRKEKIIERLRLPGAIVTKVLDFLSSRGFIEERDGEFHTTNLWLHVAHDSPEIIKHHTNWRLRSLLALEQELANDLHFSSVVAISENDAREIKKLLLDYLERAKKKMQESPSEDLYSLNIDFFRL